MNTLDGGWSLDRDQAVLMPKRNRWSHPVVKNLESRDDSETIDHLCEISNLWVEPHFFYPFLVASVSHKDWCTPRGLFRRK